MQQGEGNEPEEVGSMEEVRYKDIFKFIQGSDRTKSGNLQILVIKAGQGLETILPANVC